MEYLLGGAQMKRTDRYYIETIGIPSLVLQERAALSAAQAAEQMTKRGDQILVFCGRGNNGADGIAAARILLQHGRRPLVLLLGEEEQATAENRMQRAAAEKIGVAIVAGDAAEEYPIEKETALIIDAMFGVGLHRPVAGIWAEAVRKIRRSGIRVLAVDLPSGISSDTGECLGEAVSADTTVTFEYRKLGMLKSSHCGKIITAGIGLSMLPQLKKELEAEAPLIYTLTEEDLFRIPKRDPEGNKGTFGKILLAAGSRHMCGAAYMSALAAYRSGAGLVRIYTDQAILPSLFTLLPEAVLYGYDKTGWEQKEAHVLQQFMEQADVLAAGPGLSDSDQAGAITVQMADYAKETGKPIVLDADALNYIAAHPEQKKKLGPSMILTPHMGEMSRLTGLSVKELKQDPAAAAKRFYEETGAVCVLKDARTVTASANGICMNLAGNCGMAAGGSGDVLTGVICGMLASHLSPADAAELGVYVHALAGDLAAEQSGLHGLMATETADKIGTVLKRTESR